MSILNDTSCGWINNQDQRLNIKTLNKDCNCDYLIVGAGFTGLSAGRKLGQLYKNKKIIIVDAQLAGEGASSRNSGYLVDTTLNDGFNSTKKIEEYRVKVKIYEEGIKTVKNFVKEYQVNCDWNECGKYFASSKIIDEKKVFDFSEILSSLNYKHEIYYHKDLLNKIGTNFYKIALYTYGGVLLNPAKLVRAMIDTLPQNVKLYENSFLINWKKTNSVIECKFKNNTIKAQKIIFCTNGFLSSQGIKKRYSFPITLTASMTRSLTDKEFNLIGSPNEWGVLPVRAMGATIRMTKDRRILIRNTAEINNPYFMKETQLKKRVKIHEIGIKKRFPNLPDNLIESSWSGIVCRSGNGSQIFEKIEKNIFVAGCYNGSGIGAGTLFGEQIALMASNQDSDEITLINEKKSLSWLPPQPLLNFGIYARLFYEKIKANSEI